MGLLHQVSRVWPTRAGGRLRHTSGYRPDSARLGHEPCRTDMHKKRVGLGVAGGVHGVAREEGRKQASANMQ